MKHSLRWHLSLMLGSAVFVASLTAAIVSFALAYHDAKEFQDDMLRQIAVLSGNDTAGTAQSVSRNQTSGKKDGNDPETRVVVIHLPRDPSPAWLATGISPGFHTLDSGGERFRVFVRHTASGGRSIVAQPTEARDEIAINSALRTLIPLLLLLPVLIWLIVRIVRRELAPIARLSRSLDEQPANRPQPVTDDAIPDEITPFVYAINRLLERVNQLMGQQRRFIADAAHELRTPLTALSIQAQNLQHAGSLEVVHERVVSLRAGIERVRQLTEQLLNLARIQAGTSSETIVGISEMARELIAEYLSVAEARRIDLGLDESRSLSIRTSPETLRLIIRNALENALKYAAPGGEVTLRLLSDRDNAVIEVVDNGPGIPASERERVFDPFYRMPGTTGEGSGLGLSIAREAAMRLGGTVSLHEREGGSGLIFRYRQRRDA